MLEHHIQQAIIYRLARVDMLRFTKLKPDDLDNKLFNYHLKLVLKSGLAVKNSKGLYELTSEGRRVGTRVKMSFLALADRAHSALFLVVRRGSDGAWLLYTRKTHPLLGKTGFMHVEPNAYEPITHTATYDCVERTGLLCTFRTLGSGYFRVFDNNEQESFTHFELLVCDDASGELAVNDERADYEWVVDPNFSAEDMLPNMPKLVSLYQAGKPFFIEETYTI